MIVTPTGTNMMMMMDLDFGLALQNHISVEDIFSENSTPTTIQTGGYEDEDPTGLFTLKSDITLLDCHNHHHDLILTLTQQQHLLQQQQQQQQPAHVHVEEEDEEEDEEMQEEEDEEEEEEVDDEAEVDEDEEDNEEEDESYSSTITAININKKKHNIITIKKTKKIGELKNKVKKVVSPSAVNNIIMKKKKIFRPSYKCGKCGQMKKGHKCTFQDQMISEILGIPWDGKSELVVPYSQLLKTSPALQQLTSMQANGEGSELIMDVADTAVTVQLASSVSSTTTTTTTSSSKSRRH